MDFIEKNVSNFFYAFGILIGLLAFSRIDNYFLGWLLGASIVSIGIFIAFQEDNNDAKKGGYIVLGVLSFLFIVSYLLNGTITF